MLYQLPLLSKLSSTPAGKGEMVTALLQRRQYQRENGTVHPFGDSASICSLLHPFRLPYNNETTPRFHLMSYRYISSQYRSSHPLSKMRRYSPNTHYYILLRLSESHGLYCYLKTKLKHELPTYIKQKREKREKKKMFNMYKNACIRKKQRKNMQN